MEIIASNYGHYFDVYQLRYPTEFHGFVGYTETHNQLADEVSQGMLSEICFQGVRIHANSFQTMKSDSIQTTEDFPCVEMTFRLQGQVVHQSSGKTTFGPRQHTLSYRPDADVRTQLAVGRHHSVSIQLTETFFSRFADTDSPALAHLCNHLTQRRATSLAARYLPITPALEAQLIRLMQHHQPQPLKRLYLESTVLNLLYQQIEQVDNQLLRSITSFTPHDLDKLMAVKDLLMRQPLDSYSLAQLARYAGLNDYKLKKGFRELTGNTVFGYLNELRMQYAHQLLQDTHHTVGEVAGLLGYSETHHFSTAFKRTFGYLPSCLQHNLF